MTLDTRRVAVSLAAVLLGLVSFVPSAAAQEPTPGRPVGNATPITQPAQGVAAVAHSAPVDGQVAVLVRNSTARPARIDVVTAITVTSDGSLATRARTAEAYPQVVPPGEAALVVVRFRPRLFVGNPDPKITVKVRSTPVSASRALRVLAVSSPTLSPPQTGAVAQTLQTTISNNTKAWTARRPEVAVMCFGEAGTPTTFASAHASVRRLAPGGSGSATVPLSFLCPSYLVAARAS